MEIENDNYGVMNELRETVEDILTVRETLITALINFPDGHGRGLAANLLSTSCLALERINEKFESIITELESQKQPTEN